MRLIPGRFLRHAVAVFLCAMVVPAGAAAHERSLLVFAAASLKNAMDEVVAAYEADHDVDIDVSYAGSSTLARQIERGAPADVFVSANRDWVDRLQADGRLKNASRLDVLANALVLVAPRDSDIDLRVAPDFPIAERLADDYLAMAHTDAVPAGIYGRQALQALGVWSDLAGRIAQTEDVRGALALVARGEAPLGVVYASDAVAEDDVRVIDVFPDDSHEPIVYPAAVVAASAAESAPAFVEFLNGDTAGRVFRDWGFKRPGGGD